MATQKNLRFLYQAKNNTTGLTDVKAQVYVNGVAKAVGVSAVVASELDATNSPGVYEVVLSAANLTSWGVAQGAYSAVEVIVNSVTKTAEAIFREELTVASADDIDVRLGSPAGASVSADIAAVKVDTAAIKVDLESGSYSLQNILTAINSIKNNTGFALPMPQNMAIPPSGSKVYRVPITIQDNNDNLVDPTSSAITISLTNQAGTDRSTYLTGNASGTAPAVRDSAGQYHIDFNIPAGAIDGEELLMSASYVVSGLTQVRKSTTTMINQVSADGLATQTSVNQIIADLETGAASLATLNTGITTNNTTLNNGTYGLSALQALLANGTYGLSALQALLANGTYGLSALQAQGVAIEGSGYSSGTDSLHQLSIAIANIGSGGRAV